MRRAIRLAEQTRGAASVCDGRKQKQQLEQQIKVVDEEQARIRQNMAQLDRNTDLYKKYVIKFTAQEDQVEKLRGEIQALQAEESRQRQALDKFLIELDIS